ncbi:unnamed protein product [Thlaspi arvense]|uniref:RING-type E3 ubiquitin transferase n=1 Tax=Thlaspi arvense TaxID=13288 RepID=A0AAU9RIE4_THLAR|nr:unnamed protein product [Thlaspi arvense]
MDQNGDNLPRPDNAFSFQRLLCGDDWHQWDTFPPAVDSSANAPDPTAEMNHDHPTIESDPLLMTFTRVNHLTAEMNHDHPTIESDPLLMTFPREETAVQWSQPLTNEQFEIPLQQEDMEMYFDEFTFTYEELLELGEQIGDVCTGLSAETIDGNLCRRKYENCCGGTEKCVICLCELKYNDDASKLGCGHDFHFECIKNWLMVKNLCPLCKQEAL